MQPDVASIFEGMISGLRSSGLRDVDIARGADVSKASVCKYGRGDGENATATNFIKLASFFEQRTGAPPSIRVRR